MSKLLRVASYNIHKGFSSFNRRLTVHELREKLRGLGADLVFLQEVVGAHREHAVRHPHWPEGPQHEFLADSVWSNYAYGKNAVHAAGHHGNAILSRYPILRWDNQDISTHRLESRGLLHCEIAVPGWDEPVHCVNVHLGLLARGRRQQLSLLAHRLNRLAPPGTPLIIAGDFNDWRREASWLLARQLGVSEVFELTGGHPARTFPSSLPMLSLDRIYVRHFRVEWAKAHHGRAWARISDHAALIAGLRAP